MRIFKQTTFAFLFFIFCSISLCNATFESSSVPHQSHKRRTPTTHQYYVLSVPPSFPSDIQDLITFPILNTTLEVVEPFPNLPHHYLLRRPKLPLPKHEERTEKRLLQSWKERRLVRRSLAVKFLQNKEPSLVPQFPALRVKRNFTSSLSLLHDRAPLPPYISDINDPLFPKQWHLINSKQVGHDLNIIPLWPDVTGKGVTVAIVDDGIDIYHSDLKEAWELGKVGSWDYNDNVPTPNVKLIDDTHGTRCAGEIGARRNDVCGVGVAWDVGIAGIRILGGDILDADEAMALNHGMQTNDIYSCSWGPPDSGSALGGPSLLVQKVFWHGVQNGRGGKGNIFVFASGNGGGNEDQCNFDGYTNSIWTVTIGAITSDHAHPFYSESCAALMGVAYSSGDGTKITTTDVHKDRCTSEHGGTSAAAPLVSGIFALALQVRPDLTWRDVQYLARESAIRFNTHDPDWERTASEPPKYFSYKYGYGKIDAKAYVDAARSWNLVKPQGWFEGPVITFGNGVGATLSQKGISSMFQVTVEDLEFANLDKNRIEHVQVKVNIVAQRRGNIEVVLTSPHGVRSVLAKSRKLDENSHGFQEWTFMTLKHWGENPIGTWKLTVYNKKPSQGKGTFTDWKLTLWGQVVNPSQAREYEMQEEDAQLPIDQEETDVQVPSETSGDITVDHPVSIPQDEQQGTGGQDKGGNIVDKPNEELSNDTFLPSYSQTPTWVFALLGILIVGGGSSIAYFFIDKRRKSVFGRPYDFDLLPSGDDEYDEVEMGGIRLLEAPEHQNDFQRFTQINDEEDEDGPVRLHSFSNTQSQSQQQYVQIRS